jgi:toxin ParE1/3/4
VNQREYDVRLLRVAVEDLNEILSYISTDRPSAADTLGLKIEKQFSLLARNPHMGPIPKEDELAQAGYRYLVVDNYLIFYVVEEDAIIVHRILHSARDYLRLF